MIRLMLKMNQMMLLTLEINQIITSTSKMMGLTPGGNKNGDFFVEMSYWKGDLQWREQP